MVLRADGIVPLVYAIPIMERVRDCLGMVTEVQGIEISVLKQIKVETISCRGYRRTNWLRSEEICEHFYS